MSYRENAKREFDELLRVRGEREALAVVAARYFVCEATLRRWLGLLPDPEVDAENENQDIAPFIGDAKAGARKGGNGFNST